MLLRLSVTRPLTADVLGGIFAPGGALIGSALALEADTPWLPIVAPGCNALGAGLTGSEGRLSF